jgi:hypothetical protein
MGIKGREYTTQGFSLQQMIAQISNLYDDLLRSRHPESPNIRESHTSKRV